MKIVASISLAIFFLLQSFVSEIDLCCDLEKIGDFICHYQDHNNEDGDNFYEFICEVYLTADGDPHQDNNEKQSHEDTPCQNCSQCTHIYQAPSNFKLEDNDTPRSINTSALIAEYRFSLNTSFLESPFQPPKV